LRYNGLDYYSKLDCEKYKGDDMRDYEENEIIYDEGERRPEDEWHPELEFSRQERRWIALSAMRTALGIGLIYIIGAGILIWLMLKIWM
jgi:hypothetical protein